MSEPYIVAIGNACFDEYYEADAWVAEGDKLLVRPMEKKAGGMIPNAASVLAGYGDHTYLIDYMNDGPGNTELKRQLAAFGLDVSHVVTDNRLPDAKCIILLTPTERTIFVLDYERPPRLVSAENMALLRGAAYIYTSATELHRFVNYMELIDDWRAHGSKLVLDMETATFQNSSDPLFRKADVLFFNDAGWAKYVGSGDPQTCVQTLLDGGCSHVIITLGADGCECFSRDAHARVPGMKVRTVDTTGAGDTFNASFVHCLLHRMPLDEAARFSNAAAARSTTILGPKGGVASAAVVRDFLRDYFRKELSV